MRAAEINTRVLPVRLKLLNTTTTTTTTTTSDMREIVCIQAGQCGDQIG